MNHINRINFQVTDQCSPCDKEELVQVVNEKAARPALPGFFGAAKRAPDTFFNCTKPGSLLPAENDCFRFLSTAGAPAISAPECFDLVKADPECSTYVAFSTERLDSALTQLDGNGRFRATAFDSDKYKSCACLLRGRELFTADSITDQAESAACQGGFDKRGCVEGFSIYSIEPKIASPAAAAVPALEWALAALLLSLVR